MAKLIADTLGAVEHRKAIYFFANKMFYIQKKPKTLHFAIGSAKKKQIAAKTL